MSNWSSYIKRRFLIKHGSMDLLVGYSLLAGSITVINSLAVHSTILSIILGTFQTALMLYMLIFKTMSELTIIVLLFLTLNIDNSFFALGKREIALYSIYCLPGVQGYMLIFLMTCCCGRVLIQTGCKMPKYQKRKYLNNFYIINFFCIATAIFMTIITILINDNDMYYHRDMWRYAARDGYQIIFLFAMLSMTVFSLKNDKEFSGKLDTVLKGMLVGVTWGSLLLILCGNYYTLWGDEYNITCPLFLFFAPGMILFSFEKKHGLFYFITGLLAIIIQIKFTVGIAGTWWIYVACVALFFFRNLFVKRKERVPNLIIKILCWMGIIGGMFFFILKGYDFEMKGQISYKLNTMLAVFDLNQDFFDWYKGLGESIQVRFEEIINVVIELLKKPWAILFGKGFGGTVIRHWGSADWDISGSTFADIQIMHKTYSSFHIGIVEIIINFGFIGVVMIIMMVKDFIKEFFKRDGNMWIVIGVLWFIYFYSLYYCLNIGVVWLCYGLYLKSNAERR